MRADLATLETSLQSNEWKALVALSVPPSFTRDLANFLALPFLDSAESLINLLLPTDLIATHSREWHIAADARIDLQEYLDRDEELQNEVDSRVLEFASGSDGNVPDYLATNIGRAHHTARLNPTAAKRVFLHAVASGDDAETWLAETLYNEQQRRGVFSADWVTTLFIRAMQDYKGPRRRQGLRELRSIADMDDIRIEVAIARHLTALARLRKSAKDNAALQLLRSSLRLGEDLEDSRHIAQVLNTLGWALARSGSAHRDEAESLLRRGLTVAAADSDTKASAFLMHTLAKLVGRRTVGRREAEELLLNSIQLGVEVNHSAHIAQALTSLGSLLSANPERRSDAIEYLRLSIEVGDEVGRSFDTRAASARLAKLDPSFKVPE